MAKKNYAAWQIKAGDFSDSWNDREKLHFFARYGVLAPSGHNSQPWKLTTENDTLLVSINPDHHLTADGSGLLSAEPYISIGTFLEVFLLAAEGFGYSIDLKLILSNSTIASLSIKGRMKSKPNLLTAITERLSNRNPYEETPVRQNILDAVTKNNFPDLRTEVITSKHDIDFVARQTESAIAGIMSKPEYRNELSEWVRTNQTLKYDGMPGFTHGFGNIKSLMSRFAIRHAPKHGPEAKKSASLINKSGALVIVYCHDDDQTSFVNAGRLFSRIFVLAYDAGLAASALGASVLDPDTRVEIKKYFKIKGRPLYILRIGKPTKPSLHSPRWPLEKILAK